MRKGQLRDDGALGGCGRPLLCLRQGRRRAPRAMPGAPHRPACVELVCTQGGFGGLRGHPSWRERYRLADRALWCQVEGWRGSEVAVGGLQCTRLYPLLTVDWTDLTSGLELHRRSWKASSQWYTLVGSASWRTRSAGSSAASGHNPGFAALAWSLRRACSKKVWWLPSRSALTITRAQSATRILTSGPSRCPGSQMAMCASAGLNMQTTRFGLVISVAPRRE